MRAAIQAHFVLRGLRIDAHRAKLVLIRIIADLTEIVCSAGPELSAVALSWIVSQEHSVVLATTDLVDGHTLQILHHLSWLNDSVPVGIAQAKLALIGVPTTVDPIANIRDKNRVSTSCIQILDTLAPKRFLRYHFRTINIFKSPLGIWFYSQ